MDDDPAVVGLQNLVRAMEAAATVTGELIDRVRDDEERLAELQENVAELGTLMQNHAAHHLEQHSLRVAPQITRTDLEQLAEQLRAELAGEVEQLTQRIDHVHTRALRALTDLTRRTPTA